MKQCDVYYCDNQVKHNYKNDVFCDRHKVKRKERDYLTMDALSDLLGMKNSTIKSRLENRSISPSATYKRRPLYDPKVVILLENNL